MSARAPPALQSNSTQVEGYLQELIDEMPHPRKLHRIAGAGGNVPPPAGADYVPRDFAETDTLHRTMMTYSFDLQKHIRDEVIEINE